MAPNLKKTTAYRQLNDKCAVLWGEPETFANGDSICAAMPGYAAGATCIGDQGAPLYAQSANPRRMPDVLVGAAGGQGGAVGAGGSTSAWEAGVWQALCVCCPWRRATHTYPL